MPIYVENSSSSGPKWNGKCLNVSDDSDWTPSAAEYPQDGTIDLSGGTSGRYLDTQWVAPQDTEWTMSGIYNVVMGVSYDMYSIHYKGNQTCDIYLGSDTEDLVLSESDKDYTPPTGTWIIEEEPPSIIIPSLVDEGYYNGTIDVTEGSGSDTTKTEEGNGDYTLTIVSTSSTDDRPAITVNGNRTLGASIPIVFQFEAVITSGTPIISAYYDGGSVIQIDPPHIVTEGLNSVPMASRSNQSMVCYFYMDGRVAWNFRLNNISSFVEG